MSLEVDIRHRLGAFTLAAAFSVEMGLTALFGRSGSGKTSLINVVAGLVRPDEGRVVIAGDVVVDRAHGVFAPSWRRRVGYVFQDARLFPHLTVRQNLLYGHWFSTEKASDREIDRVIDLLAIGSLLERRPAGLSGGEKQRVAIGRALLSSPRILLMDEPLASLDEALKQEVMPYLERLRDEARLPILYVSHAISEVARLADTIVLLSDGRVHAQGPITDILPRLDLFPMTGRSEAGAVIEATVEGHEPAFGLTRLVSRAGTWRIAGVSAPVGTRIRLRVRARDVMVARTRPEDISAVNVFPATVKEIATSDAPMIDIRLDCNGEALLARLTRHSIDRLGLTPGVPVFALIKSVALDRRDIGGVAHRSTDTEPVG
jgi:molybdate transport system ATP-binding protein